ncbi:6-phospho-beta-glucosidase [Halolactibacillus halophilus]|uniref:6-phospho-beta-glucosidase n=1 Tax=Halolactibacillus halophilus TaxID=306540 RepID=A0A1I5P273_9BACI|nr:6-phospho-beta-glucosidase [Halolactibacillus halophilus]GEM01526.1 putative 6-phospho-beta-glucosidase [Halolactibacillus halophilus]SFP28077.1 6-phospho-beta-glucosidase [Halolactibacillus halophilus]
MKLVIIGGGSSYTPEIIEGLINRHASFPVSQIVLVDIDEGFEKMSIVGELAKRMIEASGVLIDLSWTTDRKEALKDANFVSTQLRVGGLKAREKDERIPLSHGMIGQETNGAGGIFKAFRTIPVLLDIANDIHNICPDAWMINFTNPAGMVTEALLHHSPHKRVIGVCNIPFNMQQSIAEVLEVNPSAVRIEFVGLNHFVYGKKVYANGVDRTQEVLDRLIDQVVNYSPANIVNLGWTETFLKSLQLLPNPYHQYYYKQEATLEKDVKSYEENGTRSEVVQEVERKLFELYKQPTLHEKPKELESRGGAYYSDVACSLMSAIYNNSHEIMTVNTLNNGAISDLADDSVVEVNCVITKSGPMPLVTGALPSQVKGDILKMKAFEELVIKASISGKYEDAYLAFLANPLIGDEDRAKVVLDELLEAHKVYLPQFNK